MRRLKECGASRPHFSIPVGGPPYHLEAPGGADALPRNPAPSPLCSLTRALPLPRPSGQSAIALSRACPGSRLWLNLFCLGGECLKNAISLLNSPLLPSKEKAVIVFLQVPLYYQDQLLHNVHTIAAEHPRRNPSLSERPGIRNPNGLLLIL